MPDPAGTVEPPVFEVLVGDAMDTHHDLPMLAYHALVCSPPYYNQRHYDGPESVWPTIRSHDACPDGAHAWGDRLFERVRGQAAGESAGVGNTKRRLAPPVRDHGRFCSRCNAWQGKLGGEPTLAEYCRHLEALIDGLSRHLRPDATVWLVLGDSHDPHGGGVLDVPVRVADTFRNDGWVVVSNVVWYARDRPPESVMGWHYAPHHVLDKTIRKFVPCPGCATCLPNGGYVLRRWSGRPTRAYETVLMLAQTPGYYYDVAVRQPGTNKALTNVWDISVGCGDSTGHVAPYPEALVARILSVATSPQNCGRCGAPYARRWDENRTEATGWKPKLVPSETFLPTCVCPPGQPVDGPLVLDPFSGSGTTGVATLLAGGRYTGIEINPADVMRSGVRLNDALARRALRARNG